MCVCVWVCGCVGEWVCVRVRVRVRVCVRVFRVEIPTTGYPGHAGAGYWRLG